MIFPRKKLILPCHKNGYLQSASDARKWRDRFKRNPLAKVADMFVPKPLRMSPGYPCCCESWTPGYECTACIEDTIRTQYQVEISGLTQGVSGGCVSCPSMDGKYIVTQSGPTYPCLFFYYFDPVICTGVDAVQLNFTLGDPGLRVYVSLRGFSTGAHACWYYDYDDYPYSCELNSPLELHIVPSTGWGSCDSKAYCRNDVDPSASCIVTGA